MPQFSNDVECRKCLEKLRKEFEIYLADKLAKRTVYKHVVIIGLLIDYLCFDCGVRDLDDITVGMVNSGFRKWHTSKIQDALESEIKSSVKKFFLFLEKEKGFANQKVMDSFKKR